VATPNLSRNFVESLGRPANRDQFVQRMDFLKSPKSQWFGRHSWGDENQTNEALKLSGTSILTNFNQYVGSNTRVLSSSMVTETRFSFTQFYNTTGPELAFTLRAVARLPRAATRRRCAVS